MSKAKHSPAPWTVIEVAGYPLYVYAERGMVADFHEYNERFPRDKAYLEAVCRMRGVGAGMASDGTQLANAQLIAAAPDLLEACEMVLNNRDSHLGYDNEPDWVKAVWSAVEKAKGGAA